MRLHRLLTGMDGNAWRSRGNAFGQAHIPAAFAAIHAQDDFGVAGGRIEWRFYQKKIRTHLGNGDGRTTDQQLHVHLRGMSALT